MGLSLLCWDMHSTLLVHVMDDGLERAPPSLQETLEPDSLAWPSGLANQQLLVTFDLQSAGFDYR